MSSSFKPDEVSKTELSSNIFNIEESEPQTNVKPTWQQNTETPGLKELIEAISTSEKSLQMPGSSVAAAILEDLLREFSAEVRLSPMIFSHFRRFEADKRAICVQNNHQMVEDFLSEVQAFLHQGNYAKELLERLNTPIDCNEREKLRQIQNPLNGEFKLKPPGPLPPELMTYFMVTPPPPIYHNFFHARNILSRKKTV